MNQDQDDLPSVCECEGCTAEVKAYQPTDESTLQKLLKLAAYNSVKYRNKKQCSVHNYLLHFDSPICRSFHCLCMSRITL